MNRMPQNVESVFSQYSASVKTGLLSLRRRIFTIADQIDAGPIDETLKWGQPSYQTSKKRIGTPIRLGVPKNTSERYALYVHCQTTIVEEVRTMFGSVFDYESTRAIIFHTQHPPPKKPLDTVIAMALTYHRRDKLK